MDWQKQIEVLSPLFNRGAFQNSPEIRVPSIRGMVRWWFRKLGGTAEEEKSVFGGMKNFAPRVDGVRASQLTFRVSDIQAKKSPQDKPTLPHKHGGQSSPKAAFEPGATFTLEVFSRFGSLDSQLETKARNALEVWLLLGSLGLRANRGGGSLWPKENALTTPEELKSRLAELKCPWPVYLAGTEVGTDWLSLQKAATDTCEQPESIFGRARGGRLSSPLKIKAIRLNGTLRLLITAPTEQILQQAQQALRNKPTPALSKPGTWKKISP